MLPDAGERLAFGDVGQVDLVISRLRTAFRRHWVPVGCFDRLFALGLTGVRSKHDVLLIVFAILILVEDHGVLLTLVAMEDVVAVYIMLDYDLWGNVAAPPGIVALLGGWTVVDAFTRIYSFSAYVDAIIIWIIFGSFQIMLTFKGSLFQALVLIVEAVFWTTLLALMVLLRLHFGEIGLLLRIHVRQVNIFWRGPRDTVHLTLLSMDIFIYRAHALPLGFLFCCELGAILLSLFKGVIEAFFLNILLLALPLVGVEVAIVLKAFGQLRTWCLLSSVAVVIHFHKFSRFYDLNYILIYFGQ